MVIDFTIWRTGTFVVALVAVTLGSGMSTAHAGVADFHDRDPGEALVPWNAKDTGVACLDDAVCPNGEFCAQWPPGAGKSCWDPDKGTGVLVFRHCTGCHNQRDDPLGDGGEVILPGTMQGMAAFEVVTAKTMPPFPPEVPHDPHPPIDPDWTPAGTSYPDDSRPALAAAFALKAGSLQIPKADRNQMENWFFRYDAAASLGDYRAAWGPPVPLAPDDGQIWRRPVAAEHISETAMGAAETFKPLRSRYLDAEPGDELPAASNWWNENPDHGGSISHEATENAAPADRPVVVHPHVTCFLTPLDDFTGQRSPNRINPDAIHAIDRRMDDIYRNFSIPEDACCVIDEDTGACDPAAENVSVQSAFAAATAAYPGIDTKKVRVAEFRANTQIAHHALIYTQAPDDPARVLNVQRLEHYGDPALDDTGTHPDYPDADPPLPIDCGYPGTPESLSCYYQRIPHRRNLNGTVWGGHAPLASLGFTPSGGLGAWAPGMIYPPMGAGLYKVLPDGHDLVVQVHYSIGKIAFGAHTYLDTPEIALYFVDNDDPSYDEPDVPGADDSLRCSTHAIALNVYKIVLKPDGVTKVKSCPYTIPVAVTIPGVGPHMHERGIAMQAWYQEPGGSPTVFFRIWDDNGEAGSGPIGQTMNVPGWDFNYQYRFLFAEPVKLDAGSKIWFEGWFHNASNEVVSFGDGTADEMATLYVGLHTCESGAEWEAHLCSLAALKSSRADDIVTLGGGE